MKQAKSKRNKSQVFEKELGLTQNDMKMLLYGIVCMKDGKVKFLSTDSLSQLIKHLSNFWFTLLDFSASPRISQLKINLPGWLHSLGPTTGWPSVFNQNHVLPRAQQAGEEA